MKARNRVVVEETERALADGCRKIMILYGGLHMQVSQHTPEGTRAVTSLSTCEVKISHPSQDAELDIAQARTLN